jgi:uncharacterized protein YgiM (DUF1202 family)
MFIAKKRLRFLLLSSLAAFSASLLTDGDRDAAWAWRAPPPAYWSGPHYRVLPREHRILRRGRDLFYFTGGRFYRRGYGGFSLVAPPFGLIVPVLPLGFVTLMVAGITYYELNGIYYRQAPEGYVVVEPPSTEETAPVTPATAEKGQQVIVQTEILNVRIGPDPDQDVVSQVRRGTVLMVIGSVPGWYYVKLNNGERGWVMKQFVAPIRPVVPQG